MAKCLLPALLLSFIIGYPSPCTVHGSRLHTVHTCGLGVIGGEKPPIRGSASDRAARHPCVFVRYRRGCCRAFRENPPPPSLPPYRSLSALPLAALAALRLPAPMGIFNIPMGGGFRDRPGACRNVGNPPCACPFLPCARVFHAFNSPKGVPWCGSEGLLEGWETRPACEESHRPGRKKPPEGGSKKERAPLGCPENPYSILPAMTKE